MPLDQTRPAVPEGTVADIYIYIYYACQHVQFYDMFQHVPSKSLQIGSLMRPLFTLPYSHVDPVLRNLAIILTQITLKIMSFGFVG